MTFIDFFAGVGGFRKGLELAGHKCLGFCEYDKFAVQSYRAIHETKGFYVEILNGQQLVIPSNINAKIIGNIHDNLELLEVE